MRSPLGTRVVPFEVAVDYSLAFFLFGLQVVLFLAHTTSPVLEASRSCSCTIPTLAANAPFGAASGHCQPCTRLAPHGEIVAQIQTF